MIVFLMKRAVCWSSRGYSGRGPASSRRRQERTRRAAASSWRSTAVIRPTHGAFALALGGAPAIRFDHETSEADSPTIDRVEPTDSAGDRRAAGEHSPQERGNAGDPGRSKKAGG